MRNDTVKILSTVAVGLGLTAIYIVFLNDFATVVSLSSMSMIEAVIFYTQIIRVIIITGLSFRYQIQPIVPIIVLSFEALLIPPLLVAIVLTNSPFYATLMGLILTAWFGATTVTVEPYAIFVFTRSLLRDSSVTGVLATGAFELLAVIFLSTMLAQSVGPIQGLVGLGTLIINQIRTLTSAGGVPNPGQDPFTELGLLLFFIGMLLYMTVGNYQQGSRMRLPWMLVVGFAGLILAFIWLAVASPVQPDIFVSLTAPSVALLIIIWGTARGR